MMNRRDIIFGFSALPVLGWATPVLAHRERLTTTEIKWNQALQAVEIMHVFHTHHTETALKKLGVIVGGDLQILANQARLAVYAEENFSLKNQDGVALPIQTIGAEADGESINVYQECRLPESPPALMVKCSFLRPGVASQINEVHLNIHNRISSIRLSGRQTQKLLIAK